MSEPENFLSRWSRRKLEPSQPSDEAAAPESGQADETKARAPQHRKTAAPAPAPKPQEPAFDLASLPPIESITAGTDIRDFLKPGVPLSLSRAALRRAWTSDPAIRDFIGHCRKPVGLHRPRFHPRLRADRSGGCAERLLAHMVGSDQERRRVSRPCTGAESARSATAAAGNRDQRGTKRPPPEFHKMPRLRQVTAESATAEPERDTSQRNKENDAPQKNGEPDAELSYAQRRHGHGSALPH